MISIQITAQVSRHVSSGMLGAQCEDSQAAHVVGTRGALVGYGAPCHGMLCPHNSVLAWERADMFTEDGVRGRASACVEMLLAQSWRDSHSHGSTMTDTSELFHLFSRGHAWF